MTLSVKDSNTELLVNFNKDLTEINHYEKRKFSWFLYYSGFTANLLLVSGGFCSVWRSSAIPKLTSNDTNINPLGAPITTTQVSILSSIVPATSIISLLIMAKISDIIGRRKTMMCIAAFWVCSNIAIAFSNYIYIYYISLVIIGMCNCGAFISVPVYNTEIAEDKNRATLTCFMGSSIPVGILLGYVFGSIASVKSLTIIGTIPLLLHLVFSIMTLESPVFLASKNKTHEALRTLEKLRNCYIPRIIQQEYEKIKEVSICKKNNKVNILEIFKNKSPRKAFLISIQIGAIQQLSGILVMLAFMAPIFNEADSNLSGDNVSILVGVVQSLVFLVASCIVEKLGRRRLMIFSSLNCACPMFLLGLYFYLNHIESEIVDHIRWLPILCVIIYFVSYGLGLGPIPIGLIGELFPTDLRATGVASMLIVDNILIFIILFSFPLVSEAVGKQYCFWFYSLTGIIGCVSIYFTLPETKGKSFLEIQKILLNTKDEIV